MFDSDISMKLKPFNSMGELAIDYSDVKIHTRDYDLQLEGETDISKAVEMMF